MRCPYCQAPVAVDAAECEECRLTYPRTATLLGAVPRVTPVMFDSTGTLADPERAKLRKRANLLHDRFPDLILQIAVHAFPHEHPFSLHAFWLFNAGNFAGDSLRGSSNRALLLVLDPHRGEAAIVPGYGFEPFLQPEALDHLLELAGPAWQNARWADGISTVLDGLERLLLSIATPESALPRGKGDF